VKKGQGAHGRESSVYRRRRRGEKRGGGEGGREQSAGVDVRRSGWGLLRAAATVAVARDERGSSQLNHS
jgi:hypothetical protein